MKTALEWFIEKLEEEQLIFNHGLVEMWKKQAREMDEIRNSKITEAIIKNREQTRPLIFENGFLSGFEFGLKHSDEYYTELEKSSLPEDEFTRQYLTEKSKDAYEQSKT
jgi:hypothetical protein